MGKPLVIAPLHRGFTNARANAKRRGIDWQLSFEQWSATWSDSGKYHLRGKRRGEYQMDRIRANQGYEVGNIQIIDGRTNRTKDSPHGWRPKLTEAAVREIRATYKPRVITKVYLANKFGVSKHCIKAVLNGANWSSVA